MYFRHPTDGLGTPPLPVLYEDLPGPDARPDWFAGIIVAGALLAAVLVQHLHGTIMFAS